MTVQDPHRGQPVLTTGLPLEEAQAAMIMVHGRGATAEDILSLAPDLNQPRFAYLAPQAANSTWYPYPFMSPLAANEPYLSSALATIEGLLKYVNDAGIPTEKVILLGFSQGACLASEFMARHARRYGGLAALSGGLIGPNDAPRDYPGSLEGTPAFFGCSDVDFHIPKERVLESAEVLRKLGGEVTDRLYPNMGHTINQDEISFVQAMMKKLVE
jgi:phospholipase/carboxylesterase